MMMLTLGLATSIALTSSGQHHAFRSNGDQKAYALAEDGINSAVAVIFADGNEPPTNQDCSDPAWTTYANLLSERTTTRAEGSVAWSGVFRCGGPNITDKVWTLTSVARVTNPGGGEIGRVAKARVPLKGAPTVTMTTETVAQEVPTVSTWTETTWDTTPTTRTITNTSTTYDDPGYTGGAFMYSWGDVDACTGSGTMFISVAIITEGNFCLAGGASQVQASATLLSVKGTMTIGGTAGTGPTPPPTLRHPITATASTAIVGSTAGFITPGMIVIDGEYMTYTGFGTNPNTCNKPGTSGFVNGEACFTGLQRGFLPTRPPAGHAAGAAVDGRIYEVHSRGGCGSSCGSIHAQTLDVGPSAQLASVTKPTMRKNCRIV